MLRRAPALLAALLLLAAPAAAQSSGASAAAGPASDQQQGPPGDCETDLSEPVFSTKTGSQATGRASGGGAAPTPAEERVREIISEKGVHVVRLWAPWCDNSTREMARGWDRLLAENPDVSFSFVTVWNNGRGGAGTIERYGLPLARVTEVVPADPEQGRLDAFMGYTLDWVPSTWIFRTEEAGAPSQRVFALNYGETGAATLQTLLDTAKRADW